MKNKLEEFKLTKDQISLLQQVAKSHPYFPELALDDYVFENEIKEVKAKKLIEKNLVYMEGNHLYLVKAFAKEFWEEIVSTIPLEGSKIKSKQPKQDKETKKMAKKEVKEESTMSPKQAAELTGINPAVFRKMLRKLYGKTEGSWKVTEAQCEEVKKAYAEYKEEASKKRAENVAKLQAARKAKQAEAKPAKTKKK